MNDNSTDRFLEQHGRILSDEAWEYPSDWREPDWAAGGKVHNWRNYVSEEVQSLWPSFAIEQRLALAKNAQQIADAEEWE